MKISNANVISTIVLTLLAGPLALADGQSRQNSDPFKDLYSYFEKYTRPTASGWQVAKAAAAGAGAPFYAAFAALTSINACNNGCAEDSSNWWHVQITNNGAPIPGLQVELSLVTVCSNGAWLYSQPGQGGTDSNGYVSVYEQFQFPSCPAGGQMVSQFVAVGFGSYGYCASATLAASGSCAESQASVNVAKDTELYPNGPATCPANYFISAASQTQASNRDSRINLRGLSSDAAIASEGGAKLAIPQAGSHSTRDEDTRAAPSFQFAI